MKPRSAGQLYVRPHMSPTEIDAAILAVAAPAWRKVAMIVVTTAEHLGIVGIDQAAYDAIAERIKVLVTSGQLVSEGDLSSWRHSEGKLP